MKSSFPVVVAAVVALLSGCGGRIQPDGSADGAGGADGTSGSSGGSASSAPDPNGTTGGGFGGAGFGNGGGTGADGGSGSGAQPPPPSLVLGQCLLGASGGPTFPETLGTGAGMLGGSGRADYLWCNVTGDAGYRLELVPTRDPEVPATLRAQATLLADGEPLGTASCVLMPYEDDANVYSASFDCTLPPRGEDLPGTRLTGAIHVRPIPDTLK